MKYLVIVADGLTDQPVAERDNKTPLQLAETPNLDRLAREGGTGSAQLTPDSLPADGESAYLSLLGYDPSEHDAAAGAFAALALGVETGPDEIALCCDFVSLQSAHSDMVMKDPTAGRLTTDDARILLEALQGGIAETGVRFLAGIGHRHALILKSPPLPGRLRPPHELVGEGIRDHLPSGGREMKTLVSIITQAQILLHNHPFNKTRRLAGKDTANSIWLWGNGRRPSLPDFAQRHGGKSAAVISADPVFLGMAVACGTRPVRVAGATGHSGADLPGKVEAALRTLEDTDIVCLHIGAAREASLRGGIDDKILAIEDFDAHIVGPLLAARDAKRFDARILALSGQNGSAVSMKCGREASPYAVHPGRGKAAGSPAFDEEILRSGNRGFRAGHELISAFVKEEL